MTVRGARVAGRDVVVAEVWLVRRTAGLGVLDPGTLGAVDA
ncbi:MAG TPA: hypothetical protein VLR26_03040 [Frankiaceae bacterium]|nr:hypothetical protein [Frankiaceae bacterium]